MMTNALGLDAVLFGATAATVTTEGDEKSKADTSLRLAEWRTATGLGSFCTWTTTFLTAFGATALKDAELSSLLAQRNPFNALAKV